MTSNLNILIVDDEVDICFFLSRNLSIRKFKTSYTHSLAGVSKKIEEEKPSIILLDNHLDDGFGVDLIPSIKQSNPSIKIVLMTAYDSSDDRAKAYNNGADYFLPKPFTLSQINNIIDTIFEKDLE